MKKIFILMLFVSIFTFGINSIVFAQGNETFESIFEEILSNKESLKGGLDFLSSYTSNSARTGQLISLDQESITLGITTNLQFISLRGLKDLGNADINGAIDSLPLIKDGFIPNGYIYLGVNLTEIPIRFYIRGIYFPLSYIINDFDDILMVGGGVGLDFHDFFEMEPVELKLVLSYHFIRGIPYVSFHSWGFLANVGFKVTDWFKPYIGLGWDMATAYINADVYEIYSDYFGSDNPTRQELEDFINDPDKPSYVRDKLYNNIQEYDELSDWYIFRELLNYAANFPITIGMKFDISAFKISISYTTNIPQIFDFTAGGLSLSLGFDF